MDGPSIKNNTKTHNNPLNLGNFKDLRRKILTHQVFSGCLLCSELEKNNLSSPRDTQINKDFLRQTGKDGEIRLPIQSVFIQYTESINLEELIKLLKEIQNEYSEIIFLCSTEEQKNQTNNLLSQHSDTFKNEELQLKVELDTFEKLNLKTLREFFDQSAKIENVLPNEKFSVALLNQNLNLLEMYIDTLSLENIDKNFIYQAGVLFQKNQNRKYKNICFNHFLKNTKGFNRLKIDIANEMKNTEFIEDAFDFYHDFFSSLGINSSLIHKYKNEYISFFHGEWKLLPAQKKNILISDFKKLINSNPNDMNFLTNAATYFKEASLDDEAFDALHKAYLQTNSSEVLNRILIDSWKNLSSKDELQLLYERSKLDEKMKEMYAYFLKEQNKLEASFKLHIDLISKGYHNEDIFLSLCSGGWERLPEKRLNELVQYIENLLNTKWRKLCLKQLLNIYINKNDSKKSFEYALILHDEFPDQDTYNFLLHKNWKGLDSDSLNKLNNIFKSINLDEKALENYAYFLKEQNRLEESYKRHLDIILKSPQNENIIRSLCSGGWEQLPGDQLNELIQYVENLLNTKWRKLCLRQLLGIYYHQNDKKKSFEYALILHSEFPEQETYNFLLHKNWDVLDKNDLKKLNNIFKNAELDGKALENYAYFLKEQNKLNESLKCHLEIILEHPYNPNIIESLCSGGWEGITDKDCLLNAISIFEDLLESDWREDCMKQLLRLYKQNNQIENQFKYALKLHHEFPGQLSRDLLLYEEWKGLSKHSIQKLVLVLRDAIIKTPNDFKLRENTATYLELNNEKSEALENLLYIIDHTSSLELINQVLNKDWTGIDEMRLEKLNLFYRQTEFQDSLINLALVKHTIFLLKIDPIDLRKIQGNIAKIKESTMSLDADIYKELVKNLYENKLYDDAIYFIESLIKNKNDNTYENYRFLANIYSEKEELDKAIHFLEKIRTFNEVNIEDLKVLAWNYKKNKMYYKSVKVFNEIAQLNPKDSDAKEEILRMSNSPVKKIKLFINRFS